MYAITVRKKKKRWIQHGSEWMLTWIGSSCPATITKELVYASLDFQSSFTFRIIDFNKASFLSKLFKNWSSWFDFFSCVVLAGLLYVESVRTWSTLQSLSTYGKSWIVSSETWSLAMSSCFLLITSSSLNIWPVFLPFFSPQINTLPFGRFSSELTEYSDFIRFERSIDFFELFIEIFYNMVVCLHDLKYV